jgi:hypothetical protein
VARSPRAARVLLGTVGAASAALGVNWAWPIAGRLFYAARARGAARSD